MNMSDAECFLKVAELMSFSKAADDLYISQQAVSSHIKRLEAHYSIRLFERRPSLKLTAEGAMLLDAVRDIMLREEILTDRLSLSRNEQFGDFSIGLPANRLAAFAAQFLPRFHETYHNMTVDLIEQPSPNLPNLVKQNRVDLALPMVFEDSAFIDPVLFDTISLEEEELYLVISDRLLRESFPDAWPHCKKSFRKGVHIRDFSEVPMFLRPDYNTLHEEIVSLLRQDGIRPVIRVKTTLTSTLLPLCAKGYGILFCAPMMLNHMYHEQPQHFTNLNAFPIRDFPKKRKSVLIYHRSKYLSRPLLDGIRIIKEIYGNHETIFHSLPL